MDEQLTFDFPETEAPPGYRVCLYKDDVEMFRSGPQAPAVAAALRRSIVEQLQQSPLCLTTWEEDPRPTGWFGVNPEAGKNHIYLMRIEKDS
jgi:hypothetical protein